MEYWSIGVLEYNGVLAKILDGFRILQPVIRIPGLCYRVPGARHVRPPPSQIVLELVIVLDHFPFKLLCPSPPRRRPRPRSFVGGGGQGLAGVCYANLIAYRRIEKGIKRDASLTAQASGGRGNVRRRHKGRIADVSKA